MSTPFFHTLRALDADAHRRGRLAMAVGIGVFGLWGAWLALARVSVSEVSEQARIVAAGEPRPIQTSVAGTVRAAPVSLGDRVVPGQVLVELDATRATAAWTEA